jgi:DNA-binding transcriptional MerR regulator
MRANVSSFDVTFCDVTQLDGTLRCVLTIDELARETGLTVRNVRSHHARGLLPPPEVRGRTGYYGPAHVDRLKLIRRLQSEGLKLDGIKRLLDSPDERLLALRRAAGEPPEQTELVTAAQLAQRLALEGEDARELLRKAEALGVLARLEDGSFEVKSPALLAAAEQVVRHGVKLGHALDLIASVEHHSRALSREFIDLFMDDVFGPFASEQRWDELGEAVQDVRPLAGQALLAVFRRTMDEEIGALFDELERAWR